MSFDDEVAAGWAGADRAEPGSVVGHVTALLVAWPVDPRALFEPAGAYDWCDRPEEAAARYEQAFDAGLAGDDRRRGLVQYGSTLRNLDRPDEALAALRRAHTEFPDSASVRAFLTLALLDAGHAGEAVAELPDLALDDTSRADLRAYEAPLRRYAGALRPHDR